jgi:hypothetical protein
VSETKTRPRTFKTALAAWPDHIKAVHDEPNGETLDSLCTLLDVMDGEIVRLWGTDGHADRMDQFRISRAAAKEANVYVTTTLTERARERGRANMAARQAKEAKG